jgi:hypothetical protein
MDVFARRNDEATCVPPFPLIFVTQAASFLAVTFGPPKFYPHRPVNKPVFLWGNRLFAF